MSYLYRCIFPNTEKQRERERKMKKNNLPIPTGFTFDAPPKKKNRCKRTVGKGENKKQNPCDADSPPNEKMPPNRTMPE